MANLRAIFKHPEDLYPLVKLKLAARQAEKQIPAEPHWAFCYSMLHKVSRSFALVIQQLDTDLRDAVCIFYLVLRALDTVEDDTSIEAEVKVPILKAFHQHIYNSEWHFSCGTKEYKVLMDEFHHVSVAFLELGKGYQEAIENITMRMGEGMAKFICKEVETVDDYDEYCHYVAGLVGLGLSKLFHASGKEDLASDSISNSMGLFLQKTNIIRDYLEDINEIPKSRMFWPREIWSKYANKLEDLKYEENSVKSVHCLNDMVTNALTHVEDCLKYMHALRDPAIFRFCAIPQIMAIGTLALCYNNIQVFRGVVKMRRGLTAKVIDRTKTMSDVYGAFYDFSLMLKSKVDDADPNARKTKDNLEKILKLCRNSGALGQRNSYIIQSKPRYNATMIAAIFIIIAILLAYLSATRPTYTCPQPRVTDEALAVAIFLPPLPVDGFSVHIKGFPESATAPSVRDIFCKFGTIKKIVLELRIYKKKSVCIGFVEFEDAMSMKKAIEASPVTFGGCQTIVEERRSAYYGFQPPVRGYVLTNEVDRGRGGYGSGRGNNRGGSANRDGYQRSTKEVAAPSELLG